MSCRSSNRSRTRSNASYKSEGIKSIHPLSSLENGAIISVEGNSRRGGLSFKIDLKDAYLRVPFNKELLKNLVQMERSFMSFFPFVLDWAQHQDFSQNF